MTIEKHKQYQALYNIKEHFQDSDEVIKHLVNSSDNKELGEKLDRFFNGYKVEDFYFYLMGCLSNIELIHGLKQEQLPEESKDNYKYQVPDYLCVYKTHDNNLKTILIDVKSVNKRYFCFSKNQLKALYNYSKTINIDIWIAIYWSKYNIFTHIPISYLLKITKNRINLEEAYKNDCSSILGDKTFIFRNEPIYIETTYNPEKQENSSDIKSKYGYITNEKISIDGKNYYEISNIHSLILDALFKLEEIDIQKKDNDTVIYSEANMQGIMIKQTSLILKVLLMTHAIEPRIEYNAFKISNLCINNIMSFINPIQSFQIPNFLKDKK